MGVLYTFIGEVPVVVLPAESLIDIPSTLQTLRRRGKEGRKEGGRKRRKEGRRKVGRGEVGKVKVIGKGYNSCLSLEIFRRS